jgi:hypothetical protein
MSPRVTRALVLGALSVAARSLPTRAANAAKPRVAVVGLTAVGAPADLRERMDAAIAGGLAASGADVVDSATTRAAIRARGMAGCETASCLTAIGQASGAAHVVRGSVEVEGRSYTVRLEMLETATGAVLERREDRCEICTEAEALETASVSASALKAQVFKRRPFAGAPGPTDNATPAPVVTEVTPGAAATITETSATSTVTTSRPSRPPPDPRAGQSRVLAWVAVSVAVLALSAGITLMAIDGHGTCSPGDAMDQCRREYDTMAGGVSLTALGVATATMGVLTLSGRF